MMRQASPAVWPLYATGRTRQAIAVGQAPELAVAGDVAGIAFNAQAATVAAQIVAAEASGRAAGGPSARAPTSA